MTDKEKEAIETLFHLKHINGYVDLCEKHDVIIKSDILLKWKNATKTVLNLIQTQQKEIENKDKESHFIQSELDIANAKIIELKRIIDLMSEQLTTPLHSKAWVKEYYERKVETEDK